MVASLYFHIPFCKKKCSYCHFFVLKENEEQKARFIGALKKEYLQKKGQLKGKKILSIYFGGGTPSKLPPSFYATWIERISQDLNLEEGCEITMEVNPEDINPSIAFDYKKAGINRISMGVQSFDNALLQSLGREHDKKESLQAIDWVAKHIQNLTIDLMYDLPNQTLNSWKNTVNTVEHLPIQHLSFYNLGFEPGSAFFRKKKSLLPLIPKEEESFEMLSYGIERLESFGLKRYEISAFSKKGMQSLHNIGYWQARPFLGFGPSAFSYWGEKRFQNSCNLKKYCLFTEERTKKPEFSEKLQKNHRLKELLIIGLRMRVGVNLEELKKKAGKLNGTTLSKLKKLEGLGLVKQAGDQLRLTQKGTFLYDSVAQELI